MCQCLYIKIRSGGVGADDRLLCQSRFLLVFFLRQLLCQPLRIDLVHHVVKDPARHLVCRLVVDMQEIRCFLPETVYCSFDTLNDVFCLLVRNVIVVVLECPLQSFHALLASVLGQYLFGDVAVRGEV